MPTSPPQSSADAWLAARRRRVMLCLASLAALVRAVYLLQLASGPLLHWHRFEQSDNHFFHEWGQRIAAGELLQPAPLHPFFDWHRQVAQEVFRRHPEVLAALVGPDGTSPASEEEAARRLWDRWYGGPTFHQEPLYPYLVGLSYRLFGPDPSVVFVWQQALGVLGVLLLFAIARRRFGDLRAVIAGALLALCSPVFFYELLLLRDSLVVFWGLLLVWLWQVANEREREWLWALGGLAGGLALLLKSTFALLLAAMAAHRLATRRREPRALLRSLLPAAIGLSLALLPAVARNAAVGAPLLALQSVGTVTFVAANTADAPAGAGFYVNASIVGRILHESGGRFSSALALTLQTHPSAFVFLGHLGAKLAYSLHWYEIPVNADLAVFRAFSPVLGLPVTSGLIGPLAVLGLAICGRRELRRSWPLLVLAGAHLLAMIVMHPCSRYRAPMTAALVPFAAAGLAWLFEQARARRARRLAAGGTALLALLLAVHLPTSERMRVPRPDYLVQPHLFYTSPKADRLAAAGRPLDAAIEVEKSLFWERIFLPDALDDPPSPERARLAYVAAAIREECAARFLLAGDIGRAGRNLIRAGELWAWRARAI